jgi:hypothetical protein
MVIYRQRLAIQFVEMHCQDCLKIINEIVQEDIKANHNPNIKLLNTEKMVTVTNGIKLLDRT